MTPTTANRGLRSPTLDELAEKHGTDKGTVSQDLEPKGYTRLYERYLGPLRHEPITLLEIGVQAGASLRMWEEYFPRARIFGIDIQPKCTMYDTPRVQVMIGDQTDSEFLAAVKKATGPLDVVVDDGGHRMEQHRISLQELWPAVTPGGFYFIEDLHTAYLERFGGGYRAASSTIEYLKGLVDGINRGHEAEATLPGLAEIHFSKSLAALIHR
jgi:Methyltransferase domain